MYAMGPARMRYGYATDMLRKQGHMQWMRYRRTRHRNACDMLPAYDVCAADLLKIWYGNGRLHCGYATDVLWMRYGYAAMDARCARNRHGYATDRLHIIFVIDVL